MEVEELEKKLDKKDPQKIIEYALKNYEKIAISFSGAEDVVLIDMAAKIKSGVDVFTLDTGRLHPETYEFLDQVRNRYNINLKLFFPEGHKVEKMVSKKGLFSFYQDGHGECCGIRKVEPLKRALSSLDAWITGQRKDSNPESRAGLPVIQKSGKLIKFNPIANWSLGKVWEYIRENGVPYNRLHERGFVSIGCAPCTRPILPGQHEREGRWWWETSEKKECGIHLTPADSLPHHQKQK
jgi:phosphoadenosine phosphosulfate reductase